MPITIGSNIQALRAQRELAGATDVLGRVYERLASGQRINRASDDAAGLAIADSLRADSRVFTQAVRNLNDGLSMLSIADSALENLGVLVGRLQELATQASSGSYSSSQRNALNAEAQALGNEYRRILEATSFNGQRLIDGSNPTFSLQAGYGLAESLTVGTEIDTFSGAEGTFASFTSYSTGSSMFFNNDIALADINADGKIDAVTAGRTFTHNGYASVLLGNGDGSFGAATTYASLETEESYAIALVDVNDDGTLDMVTGGDNSAGAGTITLRHGLGDGTFGATISIWSAANSQINDLALADINQNGTLDLLAGGFTGGSSRLLSFIDTGTTFGGVADIATTGTQVVQIAMAEVEGDGDPDMLTVTSSGGTLSFNRSRGQAGTSFPAPASFALSGSTAYTLAVGDLNGDSDPDVVVGTNLGMSVYFGVVGTASFSAAVDYSFAGGNLALGDIDSDGDLDVATNSRIYRNDGSGTFIYDKDISATAGSAVRLTDVNNDSVLDYIALQDTSVGFSVALGVLSDSDLSVARLRPFSLENTTDARAAVDRFAQQQTLIHQARATVGSHQARLTTAAELLQTRATVFAQAESRIRDADIAAEAATLVRMQIRQRAASAVLASANQQPQLALTLLKA